MDDNDVPDLPDRLELKIEITAEDCTKLRGVSATPDTIHIIRCMTAAPGGSYLQRRALSAFSGEAV